MIIHETKTQQSDLERFESKIMPEPNSGCWIWMGAIDKKTGYGRFNLQNKNRMAHRVSYSLYKDWVPYGLLVCHTCDNRWCVNPDHIYIGTHSDNNLDAYRRKKRRDTSGMNGTNVKLTTEQVVYIRESRGKIRQIDLAKQFNCSQRNISLIQLNLSWKC